MKGINSTEIIWIVRYIKSKMIIHAYTDKIQAELYLTSNYDNSMVLEIIAVKLYNTIKNPLKN